MKNRIHRHFNEFKRDRELGNVIRRQLAQRGHGRFNRVKCRVDHGTATLSGFVATAVDRKLAVEAVERSPHVDGVINTIQIRPDGTVRFAVSDFVARMSSRPAETVR